MRRWPLIVIAALLLPLVPHVPVLAADCRSAAMYLKMADNALEESRAWSSSSSSSGESLSQASLEVAEHFVTIAGNKFNETECGPGILMWWFGDTWETYPYPWLVRDRNKTLVDLLRAGRTLLRTWQARRWDRAYPNEFEGAREGFHRLQMVASMNGVDPSGLPGKKPAKAAPKTIARKATAAAGVTRSTSVKCAKSNAAARTIRAAEPDTPAVAQQQGISGAVQVLITLDESSHVVDAVVQTSPSQVLNDAALVAARASVFQTEIRDCKPISARYIFTVDFTGQ